VAPVGAAVEDADGHTLPGEARVPGAGEVVRLGVQQVLLAQVQSATDAVATAPSDFPTGQLVASSNGNYSSPM
jgi:hypothetical protein